MTPKEAIEKLRDMDRQIIHGTKAFGEMAEIIALSQDQIQLLRATLKPFAALGIDNDVVDRPTIKEVRNAATVYVVTMPPK